MDRHPFHSSFTKIVADLSRILGLACLILAPAWALGQLVSDLVPKVGPGQPPPGARGGMGPWATRALLATSTDGIHFSRTGTIVSDQAGVPNAMVDPEGRARVYHIDYGNGNIIACAVQNTLLSTKGWHPDQSTTWIHRRCRVDGLPTGPRRSDPVDPTVVLLPDKTYRLYFMCATPTPSIYSATSKDGFVFQFEPGVRYAPGEPVFDPVVLKTPDGWLLWTGPDGGHFAVSKDGLHFEAKGRFTVEGQPFMTWSAAALPAAAGGGYRLYGNVVGAGPSRAMAESRDGKTWSLRPETWLEGPGDPKVEQGVAPDNGLAVLPDGTYLLAYLSPIPGVQMDPPPNAAPQPGPGNRPGPPADVRVLPDLVYGKGGGHDLKLNLLLPRTPPAGPMPVVVFIHGGGWRQGSKDPIHAPLFRLVEQGFAVASIDYRLSGEAPFPAQIEDCKCAIRWVRAHAREYHFDPEHIGVWGTSAGGHLVALLGTSGGEKSLEGKGGWAGESSRVQAVVDGCGPSDLVHMRESFQKAGFPAQRTEGIVEQFLGGPVEQKLDLARRASPVTYVTKDDPPFLIIHGDQDRTVPFPQSEVLRDALQKAGVSVQLAVVAGGGHGAVRPEHLRMLMEFFNRNLKGTR